MHYQHTLSPNTSASKYGFPDSNDNNIDVNMDA